MLYSKNEGGEQNDSLSNVKKLTECVLEDAYICKKTHSGGMKNG